MLVLGNTEKRLAAIPTSSGGLTATDLDVRRISLTGPSGREIRAGVGEIGEGPPIVFLHGLVGLNEHWEEVVTRVKHRMRCILLEVPLLQLNGADCSIEGVTAITGRFLDKYLNEPAVLAGNSFGGHVALRVAIERPEAVRALVLAGSSGLIEKTLVKGAPLRPNRAWLAEKINELFYDRTKVREADIDRAYRELSERSGARAMVRLSRTARRNHLGAEIGRIKAPALLIWGREDVVTPPQAAEQFKQLLPDSRLHWIDQCGHAPMMEHPDEFTRALIAFLEELEGSGAGATRS